MSKLARRVILYSLLFIIPSLQAKANTAKKEKPFHPGKLIMHHISDEHELNFIADYSMPLPIIFFSHNGLTCFSSSKFYDNPKTIIYKDSLKLDTTEYYAYNNYILYHEHIYYKNSTGAPITFNKKGESTNQAISVDLSITKNVVGVFLIMIIMLLVFLSIARAYKKREGKAPKGLQSLMEPVILFVRDDIARPAIGEETDRFMPFLLSLFFFIWFSNMFGMIPFLGGINVTGTVSVVTVLATIVFIITEINGRKTYWTHIFAPPHVPFPIKYLILVPIEFLNIFTKPFILVVRLCANMTAGHITMIALVSIVFLFAHGNPVTGYSLGIGTSLFTVFMNLIEFLIAFLQAYVFTILAALYFGMAVEKAHH